MHSSGSKLFIDIKISETRGYGPILDMPGYGKEIFYSFSLGIPPDYVGEPTPYYVPTP